MRASQESRPWALVWVGAGASLWGTDTFFRRPLAMSLSSPQIVLCEHLILSLVLLPAFWRARSEWRALRLSQWGAVLGIAWGGSALGTICFTEAIKLGNPTAAVFLQKTQPLFAAFLAALLLGERLQRRFWICLLFTVAGVYLVSFGESPAFFANPAILAPGRAAAALLALGAAALWGASTVFGRFVLQSVSFLTLTALRILCATPLLAAFAWFGRRQIEVHLQTRQWVSLALMALVPGLLGLVVYYRGLRGTRASLAALAELSFPATAALLNWVFLGTRITAIQAGGFLLVWLIIVYLDRSTRAGNRNSAAVAAA